MKHLFIRFTWDTSFKSAKEAIDTIENFLTHFETAVETLSEFNYFVYEDKLNEVVLSFIPKNNDIIEAESLIIKYLNPAHAEFCALDPKDFTTKTTTHVFAASIDDALKPKETKVIKSEDNVIKFDPTKHTLH